MPTADRRMVELLGLAALGAGCLTYHEAVHGRGTAAQRVALNMGAAGAAVAAGSVAGLTLEEMGLSPRDMGRGARIGGAVAAPLVAALAAAVAVRPAHGLFADDRAAELGPRALVAEVLVRIPLETALAEEVLFRGVYDAVARRSQSPRRAMVATSVAFGLWHLPPARAALERTGAGRMASTSRAGRYGAVAGTVAVTGLAGAAFAVLRERSGSVLAPVVVHLALNGAAFTGSWFVARRTPRTTTRRSSR